MYVVSWESVLLYSLTHRCVAIFLCKVFSQLANCNRVIKTHYYLVTLRHRLARVFL